MEGGAIGVDLLSEVGGVFDARDVLGVGEVVGVGVPRRVVEVEKEVVLGMLVGGGGRGHFLGLAHGLGPNSIEKFWLEI